jgi:hypothetical protein
MQHRRTQGRQSSSHNGFPARAVVGTRWPIRVEDAAELFDTVYERLAADRPFLLVCSLVFKRVRELALR